MELRLAWTIIRRWWVVPVVLTLVGVLAALLYYRSLPPTTTASVSVAVRIPPPDTNTQFETALTASQASEALIDDLVQLVPQSRFRQAVSDELKRTLNYDVRPDDIHLDPERKHREINVIVSGERDDLVLAIAKATGDVIAADPGAWVALPTKTTARPAQGTIVNLSDKADHSSSRSLLLALLRVVVGFVAGIAAVFLLHYLDTRVREPQEVAGLLGLPVLGTVPPPTAGQRGLQTALRRTDRR